MKVYILTKGDYSDYHICAVVDNKEKAELLKEALTIDGWLKNTSHYIAWQDISTNRIELREISRHDTISDSGVSECKDCDGKTILQTYVYEDRSDYAFKIAADRFAKYRAEKLNL